VLLLLAMVYHITIICVPHRQDSYIYSVDKVIYKGWHIRNLALDNSHQLYREYIVYNVYITFRELEELKRTTNVSEHIYICLRVGERMQKP
jgi:hypothetical protein